MRTVLVILALALALWGCQPAPATVPSTDPQLEKLLQDLRAAQSPVVAARLEQRVWERWGRSGSPTVDILMERAAAAQARGEGELALQFLDAAARLAPGFAEPWHRKASIAYERQDRRAALLAISETLAREPRHFGAWAGLGLIYEGLGRGEAALKAYEAALAEHPHFQPAMEGRARLGRNNGGEEI